MDHIDIARLQRLDAEHHLHPFNDNAALATRGTRILTRGEGVYVWDAEGNKLLDAFAGLWCVNLGYGRRELGEAARRQMDRLAYYNSFFQCTVESTIELAAKLAELTPADLNHAFFTNSGSEANDTILRLVRHFWTVQDQPQKNIFIGRHNGYHGTTMAGASLGGMAGMHRQGGLPIPDIHHIDPSYWFADGGDLSPDEYGIVAARRVEPGETDLEHYVGLEHLDGDSLKIRRWGTPEWPGKQCDDQAGRRELGQATACGMALPIGSCRM